MAEEGRHGQRELEQRPDEPIAGGVLQRRLGLEHAAEHRVKAIGTDELARLQRNLPKIHFAPGSSKVESKYVPDLQYIGDYLRRMNMPKFDIAIAGHANKTGKEPANVTISQARADAVAAKLKEFGVTNHNLTATGVGSAGATADGQWRKVDFAPSLVKGFNNVQDTALHEFGHMLGLDDEYVRKGDTRKNTTQLAWMRKMLGEPAYGKGKRTSTRMR
jgi:outer membrane protein OmpA-like peptidoglycan-associated protein